MNRAQEMLKEFGDDDSGRILPISVAQSIASKFPVSVRALEVAKAMYDAGITKDQWQQVEDELERLGVEILKEI